MNNKFLVKRINVGDGDVLGNDAMTPNLRFDSARTGSAAQELITFTSSSRTAHHLALNIPLVSSVSFSDLQGAI